MKILLAADAENLCKQSIEAILRESHRSQEVEVRVLHVVEPISVSTPPQMAPDFTPELGVQVSKAHGLVEAIARELRSHGCKAEGVVKKGGIRETILAQASQWNADLIVLGSHSHNGARRLLLGSVAESVARQAPCSVQIVRTPAA